MANSIRSYENGDQITRLNLEGLKESRVVGQWDFISSHWARIELLKVLN